MIVFSAYFTLIDVDWWQNQLQLCDTPVGVLVENLDFRKYNISTPLRHILCDVSGKNIRVIWNLSAPTKDDVNIIPTDFAPIVKFQQLTIVPNHV